MEGERRLVAVVAVGDQQLRVAELLRQRGAEVGVEPPEPRGDAALLGDEVGLAEPVERDRPVPEQEDRLEQRPRRAEQPQPPLLRARVRPLVREDDALLVRLDAQRGDEALAPAGDAVGADVVLREPPVRGSGSSTRAPVSRQAARSRAACSSSSGSVRWTTLCGLRARYSSRCSGEITSYGGATSPASGPATASS